MSLETINIISHRFRDRRQRRNPDRSVHFSYAL